MTYFLEKKFSISCSHRLHNNNLSETRNETLFGKCNNYPSHGHNYFIFVKLKQSSLDEETGMIINFNELKDIFNNLIDNRFDHKFLNDDEAFINLIPTAENMCKVFYDILKKQIPSLYKIKIYETEGSSASYTEEF